MRERFTGLIPRARLKQGAEALVTSVVTNGVNSILMLNDEFIPQVHSKLVAIYSDLMKARSRHILGLPKLAKGTMHELPYGGIKLDIPQVNSANVTISYQPNLDFGTADRVTLLQAAESYQVERVYVIEKDKKGNALGFEIQTRRYERGTDGEFHESVKTRVDPKLAGKARR